MEHFSWRAGAPASPEAKADGGDLHSEPPGDLKTCFSVSAFIEGVMKAPFFIINTSTKKCPSLFI